MNIAIIGSSGYIASYLFQRFSSEAQIEHILKIDQTEDADVYLNLQEADKFDYKTLDGIDYVIFTAAISGPDKCTNEYDFCWNINVTGTEYFIRHAMDMGCRVLFFSSDAVFGDIPGCIYNELSETKAHTAYGRMKKHVEDTFKENELFKAIRLSYVVSARDKFVSYCLSCAKKKETAEIFHPFYRNCISVSDVVNVVSWLINNWDTFPSFVLNVTGKELVSRIRIVDELNRFLKEKIAYAVVCPDEKFFESRPKITQMESLYLQKYNILPDNSFTEKIQTEFKEIINE